MTDDFENTAGYFLELASEQRLKILHNLSIKSFGVTQLATKLDVTAQEVHRNLDRLSKSNFTKKGMNDKYEITTQGKIMLSQMSLVKFLTKNEKFFENHNLQLIPSKFTKRLGVLGTSEHIRGVTKVLEKWTSIYKNADSYIADIVSESPPGMIKPLVSRIQNGVEYRHIVSNNLIEPENREEILKKTGYYKLVQKGKIQRKTTKTVSTIVLLNEKESAVIFPSTTNETDLKHMFYSKDSAFHEWCIDYFDYIWKKSKTMRTKSN
ncbi:helix-turn-helix transcriptional regulator [Nitrosopumilus sp.]|uniref:helix-turn-helix transcriptional regulator n=1 Tax=Nitrosopumilus sp. TaxID=2024843 RepID=UPI003D14C753